MHIIIETNRLVLREFTTADAALIYELNNDPEVTRFTGDPIRDTDHAKEVLVNTILPQYALYNYGRWAVHIKPSHLFVGWCGLKFRPERNEVDLGYRFRKEYWGRGYATETAAACLRYGFEKLGIRKIVAHSMPGNLGSVKVLENCGMQCIGEEMVDGHQALTYEAVSPLIP